ncbi:hypothetical protein BGZ96_004120 [Linnemannia gamsii]|uniref:Bulb-type lectin domain-containing protein n=1 Tax=Linnemannia gamsii TaxID=64522 RepID=A0ABQ7K7K0_9FUNG|nr:hypothetical protein BGZ96_004120 [Linnemannia gamsii]
MSPDGLWIATSGPDRVIKIWSAETDVPEIVLRCRGGRISSLVFSPDGQWIASGGEDNTVRLWDVLLRTPGLALHGHMSSILVVVFSHCGQLVVSGSEDGTVRIWKAGTGESRVILDAFHHARAIALRYSPSNIQIALVQTGNDRLKLWDGYGENASVPLECGNWLDSIAFSHCGRWIAVGGDQCVKLWKWIDVTQKWEQKLKMNYFYGRVWGIAWRPDNSDENQNELSDDIQGDFSDKGRDEI